MNIGIITANDRPVSALSNGGSEMFVYSLARSLAKRGHNIVLFATEDSLVDGARVIPSSEQSASEIRASFAFEHNSVLSTNAQKRISDMLALRSAVFARSFEDSIDVFHDSTGSPLVGAVLGTFTKPVVSNLHTPPPYIYACEKMKKCLDYPNVCYVAVSNYQRERFPIADKRIYSGIDFDAYSSASYEGSNVLRFIGRVDTRSPKKLEDAIAAAEICKKPLEFVAVIEDKAFYEEKILPHIRGGITQRPQFSNFSEKVSFFANAKAMIVPSKAEETFGLTIAESLSAGTPVIAYARGASAELIADGMTGFIVNPSDSDIRGSFITKATGVAGLAEAAAHIYAMNDAEYGRMRRACRVRAERMFSIAAMAESYERLYNELLLRQIRS